MIYFIDCWVGTYDFIHREMESDIYQPEEGLAMGSPLWPVLVNIYMKYFEEMALESTSL